VRLAPLQQRTHAMLRLELTKTRDGFRTARTSRWCARCRTATARSRAATCPALHDGCGRRLALCHEGGVPAVYYGCGWSGPCHAGVRAVGAAGAVGAGTGGSGGAVSGAETVKRDVQG